MTSRLVVLASGSGSNLQAVLDASRNGTLAAEVSLVVTNRPDAYAAERAEQAGVGHVLWPIEAYLQGIDSGDADARRQARRRYDRSLAELVAAKAPTLVVLAGWMHVLSSDFLDRFPGQVVNLHPALPGTFPGVDAIGDAWAAFENDEIDRTGVMVHFVPDGGVDDGPVVASREVVIDTDDTLESLTERIHRVEHSLLVEAIAQALQAATAVPAAVMNTLED